MRRFVSVALALVMSLCVTVPAFAAKTGQAITFIAAAGRHDSVRRCVSSEEYEGHYVVQITEDLNAFERRFQRP